MPITIFKMGKVFANIASYYVFILFLLSRKVASRHLDYDAAELVSDGATTPEQESFLRLNEMDSSEKQCHQMYWILPCATNAPSQFFLIVIYEYLLYQGEYYASGDGRFFRVFGESFWSAFFYQLLDSLPESLILLATGLMSNKEKAQDNVVMGVGLLAGSSILLLTLLWGICFICARKEFDVEPGPEQRNQETQLLTDARINNHSQIMNFVLKMKDKVVQLSTGSGIITEDEATYNALKIFISLIPFASTLVVSAYAWYFSERNNTFLIPVLLIVVRSFYTYFRAQRQIIGVLNTRLEYAQVERKVEMNVSFYEVKALIQDREKHLTVKEKEMERLLKHPELNDDKAMTREKFYDMFKKWLQETRQLMDDPYSTDQSGTKYNQVVELLHEDKNKMTELISYMMEFALGGKFPIQDGGPDKSFIDRFFKRIDANDDKLITRFELKNYIMELNLDEIRMEGVTPTQDEIIEIIMERLDNDESGDIDQEEFNYGVKKWLEGINVASRNQQKQSHNSNREIYEYQHGEEKAKAQKKETQNAITLLIVGIIMLMAFAEPLVETVQQFSESINIEPFYVSFCIVPLATNARTAIAAIKSANQRSQHTTTLTFSEIYHKVFMNNTLGLFVLVLVIYFRGLTWHFSVEILVVAIVCSIMGCLAVSRSKFPNWTLLIVFPLYPLSLAMVYFFNDTFHLA